MLTDALLRCGDALHQDERYAAEVMRTRRLIQPSIARHLDAWIERRDGVTGALCTECRGAGIIRGPGPHQLAGFWVGDDGKPLKPGKPVPKDAYTGMEGAIMEILHLDGIYWIKSKPKRDTKGAYQEAIQKSRRYGEDVQGAAKDDDEDDGED